MLIYSTKDRSVDAVVKSSISAWYRTEEWRSLEGVYPNPDPYLLKHRPNLVSSQSACWLGSVIGRDPVRIIRRLKSSKLEHELRATHRGKRNRIMIIEVSSQYLEQINYWVKRFLYLTNCKRRSKAKTFLSYCVPPQVVRQTTIHAIWLRPQKGVWGMWRKAREYIGCWESNPFFVPHGNRYPYQPRWNP